MPRSASALFSHVVADNAALYRAILDAFAASKRQFRPHLRPDDVLIEAAWSGGAPGEARSPPEHLFAASASSSAIEANESLTRLANRYDVSLWRGRGNPSY